MAIYYTEMEHDTSSIGKRDHDYDLMEESSRIAAEGAENNDIYALAQDVQVYLFEETEKRNAFVGDNEQARAVEPYIRPIT